MLDSYTLRLAVVMANILLKKGGYDLVGDFGLE